MYLCNCNGLTVTEIKKACSDGLTNAEDVFECFGVEKCCGKCIPEIKEYINSSNKNITIISTITKSPYENTNCSSNSPTKLYPK